MKFLALLVVLVLEQARPLRRDNALLLSFGRYARYLAGQFDGGHARHGLIAWMVAVIPVVAVAAIAHRLLAGLHPFAGLLWSVAVLYLTMGFRQFSRDFNEIHQSLRNGDLAAAREHVGKWCGGSSSELSSGQVARVAIEQGLLASHRHVFGPIAWFLVLGPAGAVLYRAASILAEAWRTRPGPATGDFGQFSGQAFWCLDWVPARVTAASFAVVGDFEDAVYCWRTQAGAWEPRSDGILLASAGGALGVRLGDSLQRYGTLDYRPAMGMGEEADADYMTSAVALIWRSLVLWMFLTLMVTVAHALG